MKQYECPFEAEVLAAVLDNHWPDDDGHALRNHAASCPICSDVACVAGAIDEVRQDARPHVVVPDAGRVWWRAQLRARREAARMAGSPITAIQVLAFAAAVGLLGACFGATSTWFQSSLHSIGSSLAAIDFKALIPLVTEHSILAALMAAMLLLVPTALFLVLRRD